MNGSDARGPGSPDGRGQELYRRARERIPGGTQLLSKRPEMFLPDRWPAYYERARGAEVWDLDGNCFLDMSYSGIGSLILGAADPDVDRAVLEAVRAGSMSTLNAPEEVELADLLCELHPWASMVRFARTGGEAMAIAVRIARAHTGRDRVIFCGYHGWHDWYLAANLSEDAALDGHLLPGLEPRGVPRGLRGTALPFRYNHAEELRELLRAHPGEIAAVVLEPVRNHEPEPGFLDEVARSAREAEAVLLFDEISAGFRIVTGGAHLQYGVEPDVAVFAKAMGNGYPMAAVIGTEPVMQAAQTTFISSTYWTDRVGPAAALATIRKHRREDVGAHLVRIGGRVQEGWRSAANRVALEVEVGGIAPLGHLHFLPSSPAHASQAVRTLYTRLMLERGFLATGSFYANFAHTDNHVDRFLEAVEEVFGLVAEAHADGRVEELLDGPPAHGGFRRLT